MADHDEHEQQQQQDDEQGVRRGSSPEQRLRWRQRAMWLSQLGLAPDDDVPVEAVEEVADAVVALLGELEQLELRVGGARPPTG